MELMSWNKASATCRCCKLPFMTSPLSDGADVTAARVSCAEGALVPWTPLLAPWLRWSRNLGRNSCCKSSVETFAGA